MGDVPYTTVMCFFCTNASKCGFSLAVVLDKWIHLHLGDWCLPLWHRDLRQRYEVFSFQYLQNMVTTVVSLIWKAPQMYSFWQGMFWGMKSSASSLFRVCCGIQQELEQFCHEPCSPSYFHHVIAASVVVQVCNRMADRKGQAMLESCSAVKERKREWGNRGGGREVDQWLSWDLHMCACANFLLGYICFAVIVYECLWSGNLGNCSLKTAELQGKEIVL